MIKRKTNDAAGEYERLLAQEELILEATEAIVCLLAEAGMNRQELADRLGRSKGFVSQILTGQRNMTLRTLADVGAVLDHRFRLHPVPSRARAARGGSSGPRLFHQEGLRNAPPPDPARPGARPATNVRVAAEALRRSAPQPGPGSHDFPLSA